MYIIDQVSVYNQFQFLSWHKKYIWNHIIDAFVMARLILNKNFISADSSSCIYACAGGYMSVLRVYVQQ